jgi:two-component system phosphate regulon sensor histidine kinase PhoR
MPTKIQKSILIVVAAGIVGALFGYALQVPFNSARLQAWRTLQETSAQRDLVDLEERDLRSDSASVAAFEKHIADGELRWGTASGSSTSPETIWSSEPSGFYRLEARRAWTLPTSERKTATLIRRFEKANVTQAVGAFSPGVLLFAALGILGAIVWIWTNRRAETNVRWMQSIAGSLRREAPLPKHPSPDGWLSEGIYAIADSMREQILSVRTSHENSSSAMTNMPIGILSFDMELRLIFCNPAGKQLLAIERANVGQRLIEVLRIPSVVECVSATNVTGRASEIELEMSTEKTWLRLRASPLRKDTVKATDPPSDPVPVLLTVTDETRIKQLENLRRDFTANVSHELKTPLSAIKAYAETLLMGALEDPHASHRFVERISEQTARLDNLIRDLLQLNRLQAQPEKPVQRPVQITDVVEKVIEDHHTVASSNSVTLHFEPNETIEVLSDLESLQTILNNLLGNAIRYNKPNGHVYVQTFRRENRCIVQVRDTGIGIPPEDVDRVFERFYRVEKARSQDMGGTGLGLAIVKHLCHWISATVEVKSELGVGSTFEVSFPLANGRVRQD